MYQSRCKNRFLLIISLLAGFALLCMGGVQNTPLLFAASNNNHNPSVQNGKTKTPTVLPSLIISQREIDLGTLSMGQEKEASFTVRNIGSDSLSWMILPPESWFPLDQTELKGRSTGNDELVNLKISVVKKDDDMQEVPVITNLAVQLTFENRDNRLICVRELPVGYHRDMIKIETTTGIKRTIFIKFNLIQQQEDMSFSLNPPRMDFGLLKNDMPVTKRIRLVNKTNETIRWKTAVSAQNTTATTFLQARYFSFVNDEVSGKEIYTVPARLDKQLQLSGSWKEYQGYPSINGKSILKFDFYGRSLALFIKKLNSTGQFNAYIDNNLIKSFEFAETDEDYEFYEIPIVDDLLEIQHSLTLALNGTGIAIEGVRVGRQDVLEGKRNWISVFPESGFTLKETDYINITLTPNQANPGIYTNTLQITSNNGSLDIPISFEIISNTAPEYIDIYRYYKGNSYLYITNLSTEEMRLTSKGFIKQGLAFHLFQPGTPGTIPFHRWYNPNMINQFYSYDYQKGSSMLGYIYEGAIGNIATSRLSNTRELYRWFNPRTKQHFYSLDARGEGMTKKGYVFDGIAGYAK